MSTIRVDTRFSTFLQGQQADPQVRKRLVTSAAAAAIALVTAGAFGYTADKLGVRPVSAPTLQYAIVLELDSPPPPAPKPPPPPIDKAQTGGGTADPTPAEPKPEPVRAPKDAPLESPPSEATAPKTGNGPAGPPNFGLQGAGPPGLPGGTCANPPCGDTIGAGIGIRRPVKTAPQRQMKPATVVKANAIFAPDPDQRRLARTKSAMMGSRGGGVSSVSFCVSASGAVTDVRTVTRFPGDTEVDRICREAVKRWRFNAFIVDGKPRKTCTTSTFKIEFE